MQFFGSRPAFQRLRRVLALLLVALEFLFCAGAARAGHGIVVAQDGTGDFTTVQAAIFAVPDKRTTRTTIYIRPGTYREKIIVPKRRNRITLMGDDRDTTIITYDDHAFVYPDQTVSGTADTPTFFVRGKDFGACNITFSNTAGNVGPAIAMGITGNHAHFFNCAFLGYQDTISNYGRKAFFKHCYIEGAIDFIFGPATAVFQRCTLHCLDYGYIAASSTREDEAYGFVFKNCKIEGDAAVGSVALGRPLTEGAKIVYINCAMDDEIALEGWEDYLDLGAGGTASFAEYNSTGDGATTANRLDWSGQLTASEVDEYTVRNIFFLPSIIADAKMMLAAPAWYEDY